MRYSSLSIILSNAVCPFQAGVWLLWWRGAFVFRLPPLMVMVIFPCNRWCTGESLSCRSKCKKNIGRSFPTVRPISAALKGE